MKVSLNGSIVDRENAFTVVETDGLFYGAGCFETLTSYYGKFLHLDSHTLRLNEGLCYLTGVNKEHVTEDQLKSNILNLLHENNLIGAKARVRIQYSIAERLGYSTNDRATPRFISLITVDQISDNVATTYTLSTVETTVVPSSSRPSHLKLSNMLHYRQAAIEAKQAGADDALMLTVNGDIAETSIANIFWEKNGRFYTPSGDCDILPGIALSSVIKLFDKMGKRIEEGRFHPKELKKASHVWMCNSIREIVSISKIDDQEYSTHSEMGDTLLREFETYKKEHLA